MRAVPPHDVEIAQKERAVMTGLVYKEWKQNRWFILSMLLCACAPLLMLLWSQSSIREADDINTLRLFGLIAGLLAAGALQLMVLRGDNRRLWGHWVSATAEGYRGFLRVKYEMIFGMIVLFLFSLQCVDMAYCAFAADTGQTDIVSLSDFAIPLCFLQILFRAIDIPFIYRFGSKKGSMIKMICLLAVTLLAIVLLLLHPDFMETFAALRVRLFTEFSASLLLVCILGLYCLSYRVTCRLYLRGVEQYEQ